MRLSKKEVLFIKNIIKAKDSQARIFLYGSRIDDNLKGGDIDLFIISEAMGFSDKIDILIELEKKLGDRRIDLSIHSSKSIKKNAFFKSIKSIEI